MIVQSSDDGLGLDVTAPAKLNLFLEVLGRRADGFHELETLMVTLDLHDRLQVAPASGDAPRIALECDDPDLPVDGRNLVMKAAASLIEEAKALGRSMAPARIRLSKAIPAQAGLGGGSSDAAATLRLLNTFWGLNLTDDRLTKLAASLGSDVPFFLNGPAAICRGRGERVEPIGSSDLGPIVLVCPPFGLSTAEVYRNVHVPDAPRSLDAVAEALRPPGDREALGAALFNRLQEPAERLRPELAALGAAMRRLVPSLLHGAMMSGSGSAFFGLGRDRAAADRAADWLKQLGPGSVRVVTSGL